MEQQVLHLLTQNLDLLRGDGREALCVWKIKLFVYLFSIRFYDFHQKTSILQNIDAVTTHSDQG